MLKSLFGSTRGAMTPKADAANEAGGRAYSLPPEQMLARYVATGCLSQTYYTSAEEQLETILDLAGKLPAEFVAKCAIYGRERGFMKDSPSVLLAVLSATPAGRAVLPKAFFRVVDNGKMLRNFVQAIRSGRCGRKSMGSLPRRLCAKWLESRHPERLFKDSVGDKPSIGDCIALARPKPGSPERSALYRHLIGKAVENPELLPPLVRQYEAWKTLPEGEPPDVPHELLTALPLADAHWKMIALRAGWHATRMNLNTFERHGVWKDPEIVSKVAAKLRDPEQISRARVFPYQLLMAFKAADSAPKEVQDALQDAMELAVGNVPDFGDLSVWVFPDVSSSMQSPVTGHRRGSTTKVRCVDVAALIAAAVLRRNQRAGVVPFSDDVVPCRLNSRDTVMTLANQLASLPSGGTCCSAPLRVLNQPQNHSNKVDVAIYVSDQESWVDSTVNYWNGGGGTETLKQWNALKVRNPKAKMICIDLTPNSTAQVKEREDILQVGGFSDSVWDLIRLFAEGNLSPAHWVGEIEKIQLD